MNPNQPAWRGVVVDGVVWAWPMILMDHNAAFREFNHLSNYTCRWRQWQPGGPVDFDDGCSPEDREKVEKWLAAVSEAAGENP